MPNYGTRMVVVDDQESRPNRNDPKSGTSGNAWSATVAFAAPCMTVDIKAIDEDCDFQLVATDGTVSGTIHVTKNSFQSIDFQAAGFKHKNTVAGPPNADYEVIGYYKA